MRTIRVKENDQGWMVEGEIGYLIHTTHSSMVEPYRDKVTALQLTDDQYEGLTKALLEAKGVRVSLYG